jgi:hypothetical protein
VSFRCVDVAGGEGQEKSGVSLEGRILDLRVWLLSRRTRRILPGALTILMISRSWMIVALFFCTIQKVDLFHQLSRDAISAAARGRC